MPTGIAKSGKRIMKTVFVTVGCKQCGAGITVTEKAMARRVPKFCSTRCFGDSKKLPIEQHASHNPKVVGECEHCGCETRSFPSKPARYCSRNCWYKANPSTFSFKAWHEKNKEAQLAKRAAWNAANIDKVRQIKRNWTKRNPEKARAIRVQRRSATKGATPEQIASVMAAADGHCTYCDKPAPLTLDHVEPVARGGNGKKYNLLPCCKSCNSSKNASDPAEWIFAKFGIEGLARAVFMLEKRKRLILT